MRLCVSGFFMFWSLLALGQTEIEKTLWWQNYLERQSESDFSIEFSELTTMINDLELHPLELDSLTINRFFFLSEDEKYAIVRHLRLFGKIISIYELQVMDGISPELCQILSRLVVIKAPQIMDESFLNWLKNGQHEALVQTECNLQKSKAFELNALGQKQYLGDRTRSLLRYRFVYKQQLYMGFAAEKDVGEPYGKPNFLSFHLFYRGKGVVKTLALGDYQAAFGMGLTFASRPPMGKGTQVFQTSGRLNGIQPYRSVTEFGFLRGAAIGLELKKTKLDFLFSGLANNGNGLHRTAKEIQDKNKDKNYVFCAHIYREFLGNSLGFVYQVNTIQAISGFRFEPNSRAGLYAKKSFGNALLETELSGDFQKINFLIQALKPLHSKADYLILFRRYAPNGISNFVGAWSEFSGAFNERGLYQALMIKPSRKVVLNFYQDIFEAMAPRYQKNMGSKGIEWMANAQIKSSKTLIWDIRWMHKKQEKDKKEGVYLLESNWQSKQQIRLQTAMQVNKQLAFKARYELNFWENQDGTSFFAEVNWQNFSKTLTISARYLAFQSMHDETRIYAMEKDLPYQFTLGSFNGIGAKAYVLVRYHLNKQVDAHFKIGHLVQADGAFPGSGWDEVATPFLTKFSFQLRRKW